MPPRLWLQERVQEDPVPVPVQQGGAAAAGGAGADGPRPLRAAHRRHRPRRPLPARRRRHRRLGGVAGETEADCCTQRLCRGISYVIPVRKTAILGREYCVAFTRTPHL